jgi:hypothetical protein
MTRYRLSFPSGTFTLNSRNELVHCIEWWKDCKDLCEDQGFPQQETVARVIVDVQIPHESLVRTCRRWDSEK